MKRNHSTLQPDGKVIISGSFKKYYNNAINNILRLWMLSKSTSFRGLDNAYWSQKGFPNFINQMFYTADNDIIAVGQFKNI